MQEGGNLNLTDITTPINVKALQTCLEESNYDEAKTQFLVDGFSHGFDFGYRRPSSRRDMVDNIPLKLGTKQDLWDKVMAEVKVGRYAGPFESPPYDTFMQSPIGLVPKAGGKTRLIFHLSYDFGKEEHQKSFNYHIPAELCSVKYRDLDHAKENCIKLMKLQPGSPIYFAKTDFSAAFRQVPGKPSQYRWLLMKAEHPTNGHTYYFVDKYMPFGASISCSIFQEVSNALHHVIVFRINNVNKAVTNYLDDFLFMALLKAACDSMINQFIELCKEVNMPLSVEKTEWSTTLIVFLGILLDGSRKLLIVPEEKRTKAIRILQHLLTKNKATVKQIQSLAGLLNFLTRAIVPGRVFIRRMYTKIDRDPHHPYLMKKSAGNLKHYHHIYLDKEFKRDAGVWLNFLENASSTVMARKFTDKHCFRDAQVLDFYSDASLAETKGFGCVFGPKYTWGQWDASFIRDEKPSIEYLELYALTIGLMVWGDKLRNQNIIVFCDNQAVVHMINKTTSSCKNCMVLLRIIVLEGLIYNRRVFARFIPTKMNGRADALSRLEFSRFFRLSPLSSQFQPEKLPPHMWPVSKIWIK